MTTNTDAVPLKPCPFCGSREISIGYKGQPAEIVFAMCPDCKAAGPIQQFSFGMTFDWESAWNHRAPTPAAQADAAPYCQACGDGITAHDPGVCGNCFAMKYRDAEIATGGAQEPIYQTRLANGSWQDANERAYRYNIEHCPDDTRIVYAAPLPRVAATVPSVETVFSLLQRAVCEIPASLATELWKVTPLQVAWVIGMLLKGKSQAAETLAMTDEQIINQFYGHTVVDDEPLFTFDRKAALELARALLAASNVEQGLGS